MKTPAVIFILGIVAIHAKPREVFRYEDKETKQAHYMEGDPGTSVNGGWEFVAPGGDNYELEYVANNKGFQPLANHIPNPVEETNEVAKAKAQFLSRFKAEKNREPVVGEWEFTSPEGMPYKVSYTADQFGGFLAEADHIPVQVDDTEEVKQAKVQFYKMFDETSAKLKALNNKRVERQAVDYHSYYHPYPKVIRPAYYPTNAMYYPVRSSSPVYHPSNVQVTKTTVKLDDNMLDMSEDIGEDVDVVMPAESVVGAEGAELSPDMEPVAEVEVESESQDEPDVEPEIQPESPAVVSDAVVKEANAKPVSQLPIYYPHQAVLGSNVVSLRPAFHPFWSTRFNYLPVYPSMFYHDFKSLNTDMKRPPSYGDVGRVNALPNEIFSTFPVQKKDLKPGAIVA